MVAASVPRFWSCIAGLQIWYCILLWIFVILNWTCFGTWSFAIKLILHVKKNLKPIITNANISRKELCWQGTTSLFCKHLVTNAPPPHTRYKKKGKHKNIIVNSMRLVKDIFQNKFVPIHHCNTQTQTNHVLQIISGQAGDSIRLILSLFNCVVGRILAVNHKWKSWSWTVLGAQFESTELNLPIFSHVPLYLTYDLVLGK